METPPDDEKPRLDYAAPPARDRLQPWRIAVLTLIFIDVAILWLVLLAELFDL